MMREWRQGQLTESAQWSLTIRESTELCPRHEDTMLVSAEWTSEALLFKRCDKCAGEGVHTSMCVSVLRVVGYISQSHTKFITISMFHCRKKNVGVVTR